MRIAPWLLLVLTACSGGKEDDEPLPDSMDTDTDADTDTDTDTDTDSDTDTDTETDTPGTRTEPADLALCVSTTELDTEDDGVIDLVTIRTYDELENVIEAQLWDSPTNQISVTTYGFEGTAELSREEDTDADGVIDVVHAKEVNSDGDLIRYTRDDGNDGVIDREEVITWSAPGVRATYQSFDGGSLSLDCTYNPPDEFGRKMGYTCNDSLGAFAQGSTIVYTAGTDDYTESIDRGAGHISVYKHSFDAEGREIYYSADNQPSPGLEVELNTVYNLDGTIDETSGTQFLDGVGTLPYQLLNTYDADGYLVEVQAGFDVQGSPAPDIISREIWEWDCSAQ